jgi:CpXC protein
MMNAGNVVCPTCQNEFEFEYDLCIDLVVSPEASEEILTERLNKHSCPHCGSETLIETPLICWSDAWIAIVHAINPEAPWDISQVCLQTKYFLESSRPARSNLPTQVRAMGFMEQLRYMLRNPDAGADIRDLLQIALPHWDKEIMILTNIGNAFLNGGRPDLAFRAYSDLINYIPILLIDDKVQHDFELIAEVAEEYHRSQEFTGPTPIETLNTLRTEVNSLLKNSSSYNEEMFDFGEFEVVWYTPGPGWETEDPDQRLSYLGPYVFVQTALPSSVELNLARLFLLMHMGGVKRTLSEYSYKIDLYFTVTGEDFRSDWRKLAQSEQNGLVEFYRDLSGSDLISDLQLND